MRQALILIAAACGRIGFDARNDAAGDVRAFTAWDPPRRLDELNSAADDITPSLSADGLEIYFASFRNGQYEIFSATRASRAAVFGAPQLVPLAGVSGAGEPGLAASGLELYLSPANRPMARTTRTAIGAQWSSPAALTEFFGYWGADFGASDLRLVLTDNAAMQVYESRRADLTSSWTPPTLVRDLQLAGKAAYPTLSGDGLEIIVQCDQTGSYRIYEATRSDLDTPFGPAKEVTFPTLPGARLGDPDLTPDATILSFVVDDGDYNLYITSRTPL